MGYAIMRTDSNGSHYALRPGATQPIYDFKWPAVQDAEDMRLADPSATFEVVEVPAVKLTEPAGG